MPSLLKLNQWLPFILNKPSSFQCPARPWWLPPAHLPSFTSNQASSVISSGCIDLQCFVPEPLPLLQLPPSSHRPAVPVFLWPQLQGHNFKKDFAVHPVKSLAVFPSEGLDSQRSWSFTSLHFHSWSPRRKGTFLKCSGCIFLFPTVPWAGHSVWYRSHARGSAQ